MLVLGLMGSPRKKGNTNYLLSSFLDEAKRLGARTHTVMVCQKKIEPCRELIVCEKKGFCPIDDDMKTEIYPLLREAEVVIAASPIFFYNVTAQLKALIDRSQTLWARNYRLGLTDPGRNVRRGYMLAVGATKGKNLFKGTELTMKYFFDAVGASYEGSLTYRYIEKPGDMEKHPDVGNDVKNAVADLIAPLTARKKIIFVSDRNECRSQIAQAFTQLKAGDRIDAICGGINPSDKTSPLMVEVMKEKGIDMAFRIPGTIDEVLGDTMPDIVVNLDKRNDHPQIDGAESIVWDLPDPAEKDLDFLRSVRDEIEDKVMELVK